MQLRREHPDHGKIGVGIITHHVSIGPTAIGECDFDALRPVHDVTVREPETIRRNDKS